MTNMTHFSSSISGRPILSTGTNRQPPYSQLPHQGLRQPAHPHSGQSAHSVDGQQSYKPSPVAFEPSRSSYAQAIPQAMHQRQTPIAYDDMGAVAIPGSIAHVVVPPPLGPSQAAPATWNSCRDSVTLHVHPSHHPNSVQVKDMGDDGAPSIASGSRVGMFVSLADSLDQDNCPTRYKDATAAHHSDHASHGYEYGSQPLVSGRGGQRDEGYSSLTSMQSKPQVSGDRFLSHSRYNFQSYGDQIKGKLDPDMSCGRNSHPRGLASASLTTPLMVTRTASLSPSQMSSPWAMSYNCSGHSNSRQSRMDTEAPNMVARTSSGTMDHHFGRLALPTRSKPTVNDGECATAMPTGASLSVTAFGAYHNLDDNIDDKTSGRSMAVVGPTQTLTSASMTYSLDDAIGPVANEYSVMERHATPSTTDVFGQRPSTSAFSEDGSPSPRSGQELDDCVGHSHQKRRNVSPNCGYPRIKSPRRSSEDAVGLPTPHHLSGSYATAARHATGYTTMSPLSKSPSMAADPAPGCGLNLTSAAVHPITAVYHPQHQTFLESDDSVSGRVEYPAEDFSPLELTPVSSPAVSPPAAQSPPRPRVGPHDMQGLLICDCCPKKPRKFETEEELTAHRAEKQFECQYCPNRFKNKNEAERHQSSLHVRSHSWSCSAMTAYGQAFYESPYHPGQSDLCGYCGLEFPRTGLPGAKSPVVHATEKDWDGRVRHLQLRHKFRECNAAKKFFRADHFRQHLKHSHAGSSGKWTNNLENGCMILEIPAVALPCKK